MDKQAFLAQLRKGLSALPQDDVEDRLTFYSEMIDDRMEDGLSEEDAVSAVGSVDGIVARIISDTPLTKLARERITPKRQLSGWEILLLVLAFPIWFSLLIAAVATVFFVYISLWSVIISLWTVFASLVGCSIGLLLAGIGFAFTEHLLSGVAMIAAGIVCVGLTIFMYYGCKAATSGVVFLTKKFALWIKKCFIRKDVA